MIHQRERERETERGRLGVGGKERVNGLLFFLLKNPRRRGGVGMGGRDGGQTKLSHSFTPISCDQGTLGAG